MKTENNLKNITKWILSILNSSEDASSKEKNRWKFSSSNFILDTLFYFFNLWINNWAKFDIFHMLKTVS